MKLQLFKVCNPHSYVFYQTHRKTRRKAIADTFKEAHHFPRHPVPSSQSANKKYIDRNKDFGEVEKKTEKNIKMMLDG